MPDDTCKKIDGETWCKPGLYFQSNGKGVFLTSKRTAGIALAWVVVTVIMSVISFLSGSATSDLEAGLGEAGFTAASCFMVMLFAIPGLGIWLAVSWGGITSSLAASFGVTVNAWLDIVVTISLVAGITVQVAVILLIAFVIYIITM